MGATYYRLLSGVAHAQPHGLARFLMASGDGLGRVMLNSTAADLARDLLAGPLCAATLVEHLGWYPGWDCDAVRSLATRIPSALGAAARSAELSMTRSLGCSPSARAVIALATLAIARLHDVRQKSSRPGP